MHARLGGDDPQVLVPRQFGGEFLGQAIGEERLVATGGGVGEGQDGDAGRPRCRGHVRRGRGDVAEQPETRQVAALGHVDPQGIGIAGGQVVPLERAPQAAGLHADDGVELGVEVGVATIHVDRDGVALDPGAAAGEGLVHDELEETALLDGRPELLAVEDPVQLVPDR